MWDYYILFSALHLQCSIFMFETHFYILQLVFVCSFVCCCCSFSCSWNGNCVLVIKIIYVWTINLPCSQYSIVISMRHKSGNRMLSSVYVFGISNSSGDMLSRNSNFWKVILAETVGRIGMSIFTGKPLGNFNVTNSRSFVKCLNGAITSKTFNNISTVNGKSLLCNKNNGFGWWVIEIKRFLGHWRWYRNAYHCNGGSKRFTRFLIN